MQETGSPRLASLRRASRTLAAFVDQDHRARMLVELDGGLPPADEYVQLLRDAAGKSLAELRLEKRRRLAQIAARDLAGEIELEEVGRALSDLTDACLAAALASVEGSNDLCVIAMGKLGGRELNYVS